MSKTFVMYSMVHTTVDSFVKQALKGRVTLSTVLTKLLECSGEGPYFLPACGFSCRSS